MMQTVVGGAGRYRVLQELGIRVGDEAKLEFDEEKFRAAYATDPDAVKSMFTLVDKGIGAVMESKINKLIDPVNGVLTRENKTLDERTTQFQDRIDNLDKLLTAKRDRLERQFAQLESVLAGLQSQQQALGSLQTSTAARK
jgi:flagellar hook-associated protein 2